MQIPSLGVLNEGSKPSANAEDSDVPGPLGALGLGPGPDRTGGAPGPPLLGGKGPVKSALRRAHTEKLKPILVRGSADAASGAGGSNKARQNAAPAAATTAVSSSGVAASTPASESSADQSDSPHTEPIEIRAEGGPGGQAAGAPTADEQSETKSRPTSATTPETTTPTEEKDKESPLKKQPPSQLSPSRSKSVRTAAGQLSASGSRSRLTPPRDLDERRGALTPSDLERVGGDHNRPVRKVKSDASRPPGDDGPLQKNSGGDSGTTTSLDESVQRTKDADEDAKANVPKVRIHSTVQYISIAMIVL